MPTTKRYYVSDKETKKCVYGFYHTIGGAELRIADLEIQDIEDYDFRKDRYEIVNYVNKVYET